MNKKYTLPGQYIFLIGFVAWLIGTIHGGWSESPQSIFEQVTDFFGVILMVWGIVKDIFNGIEVSKTNNIRVDNGEFYFEDAKITNKQSND